MGGYVLSAVFICAEYQRLGVHFREQRILRVSFWVKLVFIIVEGKCLFFSSLPFLQSAYSLLLSSLPSHRIRRLSLPRRAQCRRGRGMGHRVHLHGVGVELFRGFDPGDEEGQAEDVGAASGGD